MVNHKFAEQWKVVCELDATAKEAYRKLDKAKRKAVQLAKLGNFLEVRVPINESRAVKIVNGPRKLKKEGKLFAPAFSRVFDMEEVNL